MRQDKWEPYKDTLQKKLAARKSVKDIADEYAVSLRTMTSVLKRLGLRGHKPDRKLSENVDVTPKAEPKWDFSGDNLDLRYR
jgi:N-formylglutamate amidohydrolase